MTVLRKLSKKHFLRDMLSSVILVSISSVLVYQPFVKANQTDVQKKSMPAIDKGYKATLDDIILVDLQIGAVTIDMYKYLRWYGMECQTCLRFQIGNTI